MEDHEARFYTVQQVAGRYGVSTRIIYAALKSGTLKGVRIGGWRVSEEALRAFELAGGVPAVRPEAANRPAPLPVREVRMRTVRRPASGSVVKKITI